MTTTTKLWLNLPDGHPFGLENLPYGVFATEALTPRVGVRIGDWVLDAGACAEQAGMESGEVWLTPSLNAFLGQGPQAWAAARAFLREQLTNELHRDAVTPHLYRLEDVRLQLPVEVADYVDFYASEHHATNVGRIFRPDSEPLTPNWKHLPIGYHGRAGTVVVSGTDVVRPTGQRKAPTDATPTFGASIRLDIEAELGFVVGQSTRLGERVSVDQAPDHLFGVVLLNDWSARDIQAWEYVPLGPFLGKSFATSISPWVVTMEALAEARVNVPGQDPEPLDYLRGKTPARGLDVHYEVDLNGTVVSRPEYRDMYWAPEQMLAHLTVNGASVRNGDLFGSGTISGTAKDSRGSLLELSWSGAEPITLADGSSRSFLEDGDRVTLRAWAPGPRGSKIGLGEVSGTVQPAR
jgi:fumarylacetoacetase